MEWIISLEPAIVSFIRAVLFIIGIYLVLECLYQAIYVNRGGRFCQFVKYLGSFIVGGSTIIYWLADIAISFRYGIAVIAIAGFLLPGTFYRFFDHLDRRATP